MEQTLQVLTETKTIVLIGNRALAFTLIDKDARIDSRELAPNIGIEHESLIKTLKSYQEKLELLGILRFEIGEIKGRGQPERYVLLNRNQAMFAITLSRNTEQVVDFKFDLILAFDYLATGKHAKHSDIRQVSAPERGYHITSASIQMTPEEERALVVEYVNRLWDIYGEAITANFLATSFLKRFSTDHALLRMNEAAREGLIEHFLTGHTKRYGGKFKPRQEA